MLGKFLLFFSFSFSYFLPQAHSQTLPIQHGVTAKKNINVQDYWISEKLDGVRGYWNGTQLFTRQGNIISPPPWFTVNWPAIALDGELWSKRSDFEQIVSCVRKKQASLQKNNSCWQYLKFMMFDLPEHVGTFSERIQAMKIINQKTSSPYLKMINQIKLDSSAQLTAKLTDIIEIGGEGLMLHHQDSYYLQGRNKQLLKLKKYQDGEAIVLKHIAGKGKYSKMLGAILVKTSEGITFKIGSGFTDQQRKVPPPVGTTITYQFIGKTKRGVPRFASFKRVR